MRLCTHVCVHIGKATVVLKHFLLVARC